MYLTNEQRALIEDTSGITVSHESLMEEQGVLGLCYKDKKTGYHVLIDNSIPSEEEKKVVLIHELGHIELRHLQINQFREKVKVDRLIKEMNLPKDIICKKLPQGFHSFMNICLDLEVNSKFLTFEDFDIMNERGHRLLSIDNESMNFAYQDSFEGYYEPVLEWLKKKEDSVIDVNLEEIMDWIKSMRMSGNPVLTDKQAMNPDLVIVFSGDSDSQDSEGQSEDSNTLIVKQSDETDDSNSEEGVPADSSSGEDSDEEKKGETCQVKDMFKEELESQENEKRSYGSSYVKQKLTLTNTTSKKLKDFLVSLISRQNLRRPDSMKLYNRGIRRNPQGLIYTSTRTKRDRRQMKLGILIDVSGSMGIEEMSAAINALGEIVQTLHPESKVVLWSTRLNQEWKLSNGIPDELNSGGGTDLLPGVQYLLDDNFSDIVIYSDWETAGLHKIIELASTNNFYGIFVSPHEDYTELKQKLQKYVII